MHLRQWRICLWLVLLGMLAGCTTAVEVEPTEPPVATLIPATDTPLPPALTEADIPFTPTQSRPTHTPTRTQIPTRTPQLATSASDILGLWLGIDNRDGMYRQFNEDGTCQEAKVRDAIDTNPLVRCTFYFDGTDLYITDTYVDSSLSPCPSDVSIYRVQLIDRNTIEFIEVEDTCTPRTRTRAQTHERR
jgi:hypothetical protein